MERTIKSNPKIKCLIISESFLRGGLENHILKQVVSLKDRLDFVFCFSNYQPHPSLSSYPIYNCNLGPDITIKEFYKSVQAIIDIIHSEKINVIHVHPFYSLFPAVFAGVLTSTPIVYTLHGIASLNFNNAFIGTFLQRYFLSELNLAIVSVSAHYQQTLEDAYLAKKVFYLPNTIKTSNYQHIKPVPNHCWAMVARLDNVRKAEIIEVIRHAHQLGIQQLDIYGHGPAMDELKKIAESEKNCYIRFIGWADNLLDMLSSKPYNGIIGQGQVVLEGGAAGLPVLLASYGRITGLLDETLFDRIKSRNFINVNEPNVDISFISSQMKSLNNNFKKYNLRSKIKAEFDTKIVMPQYYQILSQQQPSYSSSLVELWRKLDIAIKEPQVIINESFFNSPFLEQLIIDEFSGYYNLTNPFLIDSINQYGQTKSLHRQVDHLQQQITRLNEVVQKLPSRRIKKFIRYLTSTTTVLR